MTVIKKYVLDDDIEIFKTPKKSKSKVIKASYIFSTDDVVYVGQGEPVRAGVIEPDVSDVSGDDVKRVQETTPPPAPKVSQVDYSNDLNKARADLSNELKENFDELLHSIDSLKSARDEVMTSAENELVSLAVKIAEKIIVKQVEKDPLILKAVISDTFSKITGADQVVFKINPDDVEVFNEFKSYISTELIGIKKISISTDAAIDRGGCVIETNLGFIDVTIKEKLNIISQTFEKIKLGL